jgi:hypothetical protein
VHLRLQDLSYPTLQLWGGLGLGGIAPTDDSGYTKIYSTDAAFAALKTDGVITAWGHSDFGGKGAPTDGGYLNKSWYSHCQWVHLRLQSLNRPTL